MGSYVVAARHPVCLPDGKLAEPWTTVETDEDVEQLVADGLLVEAEASTKAPAKKGGAS